MDDDPVQEASDSPVVSRISILADDNELLKALTGRLEGLGFRTGFESYQQTFRRCSAVWDAIMRETQLAVARLAVSNVYDYRKSHLRQQQLNNTIKSNQFRNHKVPINRNGKRGAR